MNSNSNVKAAFVATAVAALFAGCGGSNQNTQAETPATSGTAGQVKCVGLNACKAQGVCAQEGHQCKGQNGCKGQGVTLTTAEDCTAKGGKQI